MSIIRTSENLISPWSLGTGIVGAFEVSWREVYSAIVSVSHDDLGDDLAFKDNAPHRIFPQPFASRYHSFQNIHECWIEASLGRFPLVTKLISLGG
jgi:hypothetical protein